MKSIIYEVKSDGKTVHINTRFGCVARLCQISAEFFSRSDETKVTMNCSFSNFQKEALKRGYIIDNKHRPKWDIETTRKGN